MSDIPIFDHYSYADSIEALLTDAFPELQTVSFNPAWDDGTETRFGDIAVPAFLIRFADPEILPGLIREDMDDLDAYYMKARINLEGYLLIPKVPSENPNVPNLNPVITMTVATMNIAAKLYAEAGGFGGGPARIDAVVLEENNTGDHFVGEVKWSHEAFIGGKPTASGQVPNQLYGLFNPCPELKTNTHNLIYENPS